LDNLAAQCPGCGATYVRSVYEAWRAPHQQQLDAWYDAFIAT
jgi:hypothetical protein